MKGKSIKKLEFTSPINVDNGFNNKRLGVAKSTIDIELWKGDIKNGEMTAEWICEDLDVYATINLYTEDSELTDYDGVFELPIQILDWLESEGVDVTEIKESQE